MRINNLLKVAVSFTLQFSLLTNCTQSSPAIESIAHSEKQSSSDSLKLESENLQKPENFLPKGYVLFKKIYGDMNNDNREDCILIIKGTDENKIVMDETYGKLDRNRRGILILFNTQEGYNLVLQNYECFSSENEDGGVYFPPQQSIAINKGIITIHYSHGRYGFWKYSFRNTSSDFELIGYDQSENRGPIINRVISINFLTKKRQEKVNTNLNGDGGDEVFTENWKSISIEKRIKLSEVKDFDELDMSVY